METAIAGVRNGSDRELFQQLSVIVGVRGCAAGQELEGQPAGILDSVVDFGWNADGVPHPDTKFFITQSHHRAAPGHVIDFFRFMMPVQSRRCGGQDCGLCQALLRIAMDSRVHEFANERSVFGGIRLGLSIFRFYFHSF